LFGAKVGFASFEIDFDLGISWTLWQKISFFVIYHGDVAFDHTIGVIRLGVRCALKIFGQIILTSLYPVIPLAVSNTPIDATMAVVFVLVILVCK